MSHCDHRRPRSSQAWADALSHVGEVLGGPVEAATLFDAFAVPGRGALRAALERRLEVVARPGERAPARLLRGDLLVRRAPGEGDLAYAATLLSGELVEGGAWPRQVALADPARPGLWVAVAEWSRNGVRHVGRRLADDRGRLDPTQLVLRARVELGRAPRFLPADAVAVDATVAVPPFEPAKRTVQTPLLSPSASAAAVAWNRLRHPAQSGVEPSELRAALASYVDLAAVQAAIDTYNLAHPAAPIDTTSGDVDAVLVEAIFQLQKRCFVDAALHDGKAGEGTLDSLGLVLRTGLNGSDQANPNRTAWVQSKDADIRSLSSNELTAATWFERMVNPSFLGWNFSHGIHLHLARRLRVAERALLAQTAYAGMTPVELAAALGIDEQHGGARPTATSRSQHTLGLAVDIKYATNPWVAASDFGGNAEFRAAAAHAALLVSGVAITFDGAYLHGLGSSTRATADVYDELALRSRELVAYLALDGDDAALRTLLAAQKAVPGVFQSGESLDDGVARWRGIVHTDLSNLSGSGSNFSPGRDPRRGFLNLAKDLVVALRDDACLAWGAIDFGAGASGDMMHFDDRRPGTLGAALNEAGFRPTRACAAPGASQPGNAPATERAAEDGRDCGCRHARRG